MQRHLYLLRHAQSAVKQISQRDIDRELTPFGCKQAEEVATFFRTKKTLPELVYSSPAQRAHSTALYLVKALELDNSIIEVRDELYEASLDEYIDLLYQLPDECLHVVITAHNPGISFFASYVAKQNLPEMVPASLVMISGSAQSWKNFLSEPREFVDMFTPQRTPYLK